MWINIIIIVGAASGVIVFNFILATWCLFCQRRQVELQTIALQKRSSSLKGNRVRFATSVKVDSRNKYASYPASGKRSLPLVPSPLASAKVRTRRSDRPRAGNLFPQKITTMPPVPTMVDFTPSVCSDDTASVYSTASAPLEVHDHLLRSHICPDIIPASSAPGIICRGVANPKDIDPMLSWTGNRSAVMEEGLCSEAYKQAIQQHPRQAVLSSCHQSASGQTPNHLLPPGLLVSVPTTGQGLSSAPMPSPYSSPSK